MRIKGVEVDLWQLEDVPDPFKTQDMCDKAVHKRPWLLKYVPDWFITKQQIKSCYDDDDYCNDDKLIKWHDGHQKRKAQKAQVKKELMPVA